MFKLLYKKTAIILTLLSLLTFTTLNFTQIAFGAAGINQMVNFQGKVVNSDGTNVTNGVYDFVFKIYDGATGSDTTLFTESWTAAALWSSTMSSAPSAGGTSLTYNTGTNESTIKVGQTIWNTTKEEPVTVIAVDTGTNVITISPTAQAWNTSDTVTNRIYVQDGIFRVAINSLNQDLSGVDFNSDTIFMGVNFDDDGEMKPRVQFAAVPYAFNAQKVNGLSVTNNGGNTLSIAANKTFTVSNSLTLTGTDSTSFAFPNASDTVVTLAATQVLTNKSLTSPTITGTPTAAGSTWADLGTVTTIDINGGTIDGTVIGGASAAAATFTDLTVNGNTILGDNIADTLTVYSTTLAFLKENAHTIQIADSTTADTTGSTLTLKGAAGVGTGAGGALALTAGAGGNTGTGGAISLTSGAGTGASVGGAITIAAGAAGSTPSGATVTGAGITLTAGTGTGVGTGTAGVGGNVTLVGGGGGTSYSTGGAGGDVILRGGSRSPNSAASDGSIIFQTSVNGAGGGSVVERWRINPSGHFISGTDNTYDIGQSGATRPRDIYTGGDVTISGGDLVSTTSSFNLINATATTVNFASAATTLNIADGAITSTIDIGGVTADGASTINIATNATSADVITIGNSHASTTLALVGGNDWSITAAGIASFGSYLQVGSATPTTYSRFGTGTTGHSLSGANDVLVTGDLEVDGTIYFDGTVNTTNLVNTGTFTTSGGAANINASSNFATNINTGTSNAAVTIGGGSNAVAVNSTTLDLDTTGALQINSSGGAISIGNDAVAQAINIGTGAAARTITMGNATGATALAFNSGTGSQTFTSLVETGTTTTSAFVFDAAEIKAGTGMYVTADELTTGKLAQFATTGNTLTTGTLLDVRSTATSLTGTAGVGSFINLDWSPGSATTATGDLFALNIGTNGTTTGNLFNILDTGSSIFSISESALTTSLPTNFTSPGDVSFAYDINFTNPTASYIKSIAPLNITAGETFNSSNLTLQTYNQGTVVVDSPATTGTSMNILSNGVTTGTGLLVNANALTTGTATSIASTSTTGGASGSSYLLSLARSGTNANATHTAYGISSTVTNTGTTSTNTAGYFSASGATTNYGIYVAAGNVNVQGLSVSSGVYTDASKNLTSTPPTSGTIGYWSRSGTTLSPATSGDAVTTSGNISTTGSGTITSAGLLTGSTGLTITGGTANINASGTAATNIGNSTGALTVASGGTSAWTNTSGNLNFSTATSGDITFTTALGTGLANILTGNLKVGNGTPGVALNGEDAYIEGTLEVDGATTFDSTVAINNATAGIGLTITQSGVNQAIYTYSNVGATADLPLVHLVADNSAFDKEVIYIQNDGVGDAISVSQGTTGTGTALKLYSDVDATANAALATIIIDNTAFDKEGLYIGNDGAGVGLSINQGTTGTEQAAFLYSNVGSSANQPLLHLIADDTAFDKETLYIQNDGTNTGIAINNTGAGAGMTIASAATSLGAAASTGVVSLASTTLTTGTLLNLELTEGTLNGGYYLRAWDVTGGGAVFTIGEDGDTVTGGDLAINGGDLTTSAATFNLINATATTINFGGAATTALNIGNGNSAYTAINIGSGTGGNTINIAGTGATGADTINIGNGGTAADTIRIGTGATANTITIGSSSTTGFSLTDDSWSVTTTGVFTTVGSSTWGNNSGDDTFLVRVGTGNLTVSSSVSSVSSGDGTDSTAAWTVAGPNGGASSATTGVTGGDAGTFSITGGNGGGVTGASGSNTGGAGGSLSLAGGNGGTATSGTGGAGAAVNITGGTGGNGSVSGGNGGSIYIVGGAAGTGGSPSAGNVLLGITSGGTARGNIGIGDASPLALLTVGASDAFQVNSSGAIAAATGITSSGTITFSGGSIDVSAAATNLAIIDNTTSAFSIKQGSDTYLSINTNNATESFLLDLPAGGGTSQTVNLFTSNIAKTINIGTGTAADTINIGTNATTANTISIGTGAVANTIVVGSATTTNLALTDDSWSITAAGAATFNGALSVNGTITDPAGNLAIGTSTNFSANTSVTLGTGTGRIIMSDYQPNGTTGGLSITNSTTHSVDLAKLVNLSHTGTITGSNKTIYSLFSSITSTGSTNNVAGYFTASGATNNYAAIFDAGNVGVGDTSPTEAKLVVNGDIYATFAEANSERLCWDGSGGSLITDCSGTPGDYAEEYGTSDESIEPGDIVMVDPTRNAFEVHKDGETGSKAWIVKSSKPYDGSVIGIVSTDPNEVIGRNFTPDENPRPVALNGRVPVKVSTENGAIEAGDYLTSSSIPGVAMKATHPGQVVGKAMESYSGTGVSRILTFVNVSFADPGNFFASLTIDDAGNLIMPKIKTANLIITTDINLARADNKGLLAYTTNTSNPNSYDLDILSSLKSLETAVIDVQDKESTTSANLALIQTSVATQSATLAELESRIKSLESSSSANNNLAMQQSDNLNLTPPEELISTGSATLADLKVTSLATFSGMLAAYDLNVSNTFKSLGETILGNTNIAGKLIVDGAFSIDNGSEINVLGLSTIPDSGILYLQKSSLAQGLDIFDGQVTIDRTGGIKAGSIMVSEYKSIAGQATGTGKIKAGTKTVEISNNQTQSNSRIFVTPTIETNVVFSVTQKVAGEKFVVTIPTIATSDIPFDWFILSENP